MRKAMFSLMTLTAATLCVDCITTDDKKEVVCPVCADTLSWSSTNANDLSYGTGLGRSEDLGDWYAQEILNKCPGWSINDGHDGGTGDTLEITSCNGGVILTWAFGAFWSAELAQGWTGMTSAGIGIGSSYQDFVKAYPGYKANGSHPLDNTGYAYLSYDTGSAFFENGVLTRLLTY